MAVEKSLLKKLVDYLKRKKALDILESVAVMAGFPRLSTMR
jgi:hypothetical protein